MGINGLYMVVGGADVTLHSLVEFWETGHGSLMPSICDPTENERYGSAGGTAVTALCCVVTFVLVLAPCLCK